MIYNCILAIIEADIPNMILNKMNQTQKRK